MKSTVKTSGMEKKKGIRKQEMEEKQRKIIILKEKVEKLELHQENKRRDMHT